MTSGNSEIVIALKSGRAIRFPESTVRPMGRTASGVRAISIDDPDDEVVGMICIDDTNTNVLVVSEKGFGKRSELEEYRITNRGGKGVKTMNITDKTGQLVAIKDVVDGDDLMIINKSGILIRIAVDTLRVVGRATQGVRLINLRDNDEIAAVTKVKAEDIDDVEDNEITSADDTSITENIENVEDNNE